MMLRWVLTGHFCFHDFLEPESVLRQQAKRTWGESERERERASANNISLYTLEMKPLPLIHPAFS